MKAADSTAIFKNRNKKKNTIYDFLTPKRQITNPLPDSKEEQIVKNEETLLSSYLERQEAYAKEKAQIEKAQIEATKKPTIHIDPELKEANRKRREKLLEDIEVQQEESKHVFRGDVNSKRDTQIAKEIRFRERKNINPFLEELLSPSFYTNKLTKPTPLPNEFIDGLEFTKLWLPLFLEDSRLSLLQPEKLDDSVFPMFIMRTAINSPFTIVSLQSCEKKANLLRENDLIIISPGDGVSKLGDLLTEINKGLTIFECKTHNYIIGYVAKRVNETSAQRYEVLIKQRYEELVLKNQNKQVRVYVRVLSCVSTQIREYQSIFNAEFVKLTDLIMKPKRIKEIERRRMKGGYYKNKEILDTLSKCYNSSQMEVLDLISRMEKNDLVLIQGPVFYLLTHLARYRENTCSHWYCYFSSLNWHPKDTCMCTFKYRNR